MIRWSRVRFRWWMLSHDARRGFAYSVGLVILMPVAAYTRGYPLEEWGWIGWGFFSIGLYCILDILWTLLKPKTPGAK